MYRLVSGVEGNENAVLDLTWWRTRSFEELRYSDRAVPSIDFVPDRIFNNFAAKEAVDAMRGFELATGESSSSFHDDARRGCYIQFCSEV